MNVGSKPDRKSIASKVSGRTKAKATKSELSFATLSSIHWICGGRSVPEWRSISGGVTG